MPQKKTREEFIEQAKIIHGDKYDYSKVEYKTTHDKVCIICPEHGEFWQTPHNHLKGEGCPICAKDKISRLKYTQDEFISKAKEIHGNKYDYSKVNYHNVTDKICIICPKHGEFWQIPYLHLNGVGCPKCAAEEQGLKSRLTQDEFISKAKEIHGDKYDYSKVNYLTSKDKVSIICPKHGEFLQTPDKHLSGCGCPKCVYVDSKDENLIYEYISNLIGQENVIRHDRTILDGKEIDIYIPSLRIGIEYNGLYFHSKEKNYHIEKTNKCKEKGVGLIQIFEDEFISHKEIVFSKISYLLNKSENLPKIMARKCIIKEIDDKMAKEFLEKNHIQGFVRATIYIGAFFNNVLYGVMTFKKENNDDKWELTRFATDIHYLCNGLGGKLFHFFVKNYTPKYIKSFADRRWTIKENNLYTKLGFKKEYDTLPDYRYYSPKDGVIRQHKFSFRKMKLHKKYGFPLSMTETQMTESLGYRKIYDCGLIKYIWKNV